MLTCYLITEIYIFTGQGLEGITFYYGICNFYKQYIGQSGWAAKGPGFGGETRGSIPTKT